MANPIAVPGTNVPSGAAVSPGGAQGVTGIPAWTTCASSFTIPAVGSTVSVPVVDTSWITTGEMIYVDQAGGTGQSGVLQVTAKAGNTLTLLNPTPAPAIPPADATQAGLLKQLSGNTTDFVDGTNTCQNLVTAVQPTIWSARLRSFSSVGNPTFEVDQANVHGLITNAANGQRIADRWFLGKPASATGTINTQCNNNTQIKVPGTNFLISRSQQLLQTGTTQSTLAAGDYVFCNQSVEGPQLRELYTDVSSISVMAYSQTVAPFTFAVSLRDIPPTKSIVYLLTIPTAGIWTLLTIPNIPAIFPTGGNFSILPGAVGYSLGICIACGTTYQAPSTGVWNTGNYLGTAGVTNGLAAANNFYLSFIQHEPGALCTTLMDKPFQQNLLESQRYYQKTYLYNVAAGTAQGAGQVGFYSVASGHAYCHVPFKQTMAKVPTLTGYSPTTGASGNVRDYTASVDRTISAVQLAGDIGFGGFTLTTPNTSIPYYGFNYTADTGW